MSFLKKFDDEYRPLLDKRAEGFRTIFEYLKSSGRRYFNILETGTLRRLDNWAGDGQSTRLFDAFVNFHDGVVFSIDIDPVAIAIARSVVSSKTHCICSDSIRFLHDFSSRNRGSCEFDLVYLDLFDLILEDPEPSSFHHVKELMAIGPLKPGTIVVVDDNLLVDGKPVGKGRMIEEYFREIGVPIVYNGYQKVWQLP